jgi:NADPH:quinone reductase-like Zn-dependent oxidoreductase
MGSESEFEEIVAHFREGRLRPVVDSVYTLANGRAAFERLASREQFGKVVVTI